jgi:hypothetical protein
MKAGNQKTNHEMMTHGYSPYRKLFLMLLLSFISMYILMYAMVNHPGNVYPNINQFYMASLMSMPMIIFEMLLMGEMYLNKRLNTILFTLSSVALIGFFLLIQSQSGVSDKQFLKGMIPHHAAALLMSEQSKTQDPEIKKLQDEIVSSQRKEIAIMKAKLKELEH